MPKRPARHAGRANQLLAVSISYIQLRELPKRYVKTQPDCFLNRSRLFHERTHWKSARKRVKNHHKDGSVFDDGSHAFSGADGLCGLEPTRRRLLRLLASTVL